MREWGATVVVKGSIARDGQTVQLTVNLIDAKNLRQIGSASFEDRAGDLATLQDEAVAKLAKLMHINVTPEMLRATGGSANPAAYESYLKALGYVLRYDTPGNLDLAITALKAAVKTDPQFALGFAELGEAYRLKNATGSESQVARGSFGELQPCAATRRSPSRGVRHARARSRRIATNSTSPCRNTSTRFNSSLTMPTR